MPPRRAKEMGIPAVNSPALFDYSEQLAILLFGQLMKWLRPLVRRGTETCRNGCRRIAVSLLPPR